MELHNLWMKILFAGIPCEKWPPSLLQYTVVHELPMSFVDLLGYMTRGINTKEAYEARGWIKNDGSLDKKKYEAAGCPKWTIKKAHKERLLKLGKDYCDEKKIEFTESFKKAIFDVDTSFHWKRAKGTIEFKETEKAVRHLILYGSADHIKWSEKINDSAMFCWLDIAFSNDDPKHFLLPKPSPIEGVTPLTGKQNAKKRYKKNRKEKEPGS
jgi:hypothetical protein